MKTESNELETEKQRTLRYKELLYGHKDLGKEIEDLERRLQTKDEALEAAAEVNEMLNKRLEEAEDTLQEISKAVTTAGMWRVPTYEASIAAKHLAKYKEPK